MELQDSDLDKIASRMADIFFNAPVENSYSQGYPLTGIGYRLSSYLTWTDKKPSIPGWYWWDGGVDTDVCVCHFGQVDIQEGLFSGGIRFAGPIEPPMTPVTNLTGGSL